MEGDVTEGIYGLAKKAMGNIFSTGDVKTAAYLEA
jgi:hypothetical protein